MLKPLAFVLPLGLDSFAVAAAIGASQTPTVAQRLRISLIFVLCEGGMPIIGLDEDEHEKASRLTASHGLALIGLGISISLDGLAVGVTIGLAHLPITAVIVAIAL